MVKKAVAGMIILGEEEEQKISVTPPEIRILNGYFQNWALIPEADRPRRVRFGGRASDVDMEGRFETALLMPMPVSGDALIGNRLRRSAGIVEVIGIESDDSVVVALKLSELIKLHIYVDSDLPRAELAVQCPPVPA